ncbi:MAG: TldD/PmbA family protein [Dehalococcoidia bacterium]|nr:TldD/PmbA family protein [Dehalococcoidia bacterium]
MPNRVTTDVIDSIKDMVFSIATEYAKRLPNTRYCDIRVEVDEGKGAGAENGNVKGSSEDYGFAFGVRVIAGRRATAAGYFGQLLGSQDLDNLPQVVREGVRHAHRRAVESARRKEAAQGRFGALGRSLSDATLAPIGIRQATIPATFVQDPRAVSLEKMVRTVTEISRQVAGLDSRLVYNAVAATSSLVRELFCSSEGASIDQSYAQSEGIAFVVARGEHGNLELYDFTGHQRGWEIMEDGYRTGIMDLPDFTTFATKLALDAVETAEAPPLDAPDKDVVVVMDPHYAALVCHEVLGHPSELDRALKYETAYAGRSWLFRTLQDNQIGKQVGSPILNVFSDPSMDAYGHFMYDHEGTPARRVYHVRNGVYEEFLNSRQTAAILGVEPNGSFRATDASVVPLIRMTNTVIAAGESDPQQMVRDVEHGYYVSGHRIPSVAESRENFRISAVKVYEIRNGELGQLYRNGSVMSDSRDFFMRIDAAGTDFRVFPIPNCGKGQPMQAKRMGNGGPTIRSVARVVRGG